LFMSISQPNASPAMQAATAGWETLLFGELMFGYRAPAMPPVFGGAFRRATPGYGDAPLNISICKPIGFSNGELSMRRRSPAARPRAPQG
jgi:hypothetical protein